MRNPIYQYSVITERGSDGDHTGTAHASHNGQHDLMLCGRSRQSMGRALCESLSVHDGIVSCDGCMSALKERKLVGLHAGPRSFTSTAKIQNGVLIDNFGGEGKIDPSFENFFAYGHHEAGAVLDIAREIAKNRLKEWDEVQITIFAHWTEHHADNGSYCWRSWRMTEEAMPSFPSSKVVPYEVTVIRHQSWPLLHQYDMNTERSCRRLKDWYLGSTKLGRPVTPGDLDLNFTPGYTVCGLPLGSTEWTCLEWPTADFEEAMTLLGKWETYGATELELFSRGWGLSFEDLKEEYAVIIRRGIQEDGPDLPITDLLAGVI